MSIPDCEVRDPRIRRTRQLLQAALRGLMQENSFDGISVQDITDRAGVNRATFYDHYNDKFALMDAMVAGGFHILLEERNIHFDGTCPSALGAIVLAACDYLLSTHATASCKVPNAFEPMMAVAMAAAIQNVLLRGISESGANRAGRELVASTASWAICGGVRDWSRAPERVPAEELARQMLPLILPMLS